MLVFMLRRERGASIMEVAFVTYFGNGVTQISSMAFTIKGHDTLGLGEICIKDLIGFFVMMLSSEPLLFYTLQKLNLITNLC